MALFSIYCTDNPAKLAKRLEVRPAHVARLQALQANGQLILAGPCPKNPDVLSDGFLGSVLILDFPTRQDLDEWLKDEPYVLEGVYAQVEVRPFIQAFPNA